MSTSHIRRRILTGLLGAATVLGQITATSTVAQAATASSATASSRQSPELVRSADQTKVDAYLAGHPGGVQTGPRDISYGGALIVTVSRDISAAAVADCPSGWFCFYDTVSYGYPRGRLSSCGFQDLGTWGWRNRVESVHYNMSSGTVAFLNEAGATDTVLFTAGTTRRTIADVNPNRNKADYVSRSGC
jgi:hypothetical protein